MCACPMPFEQNLIDRLAHLARLDLTTSEADSLGTDLARIVVAVEAIHDLDLDGIEPLLSVVSHENVLRNDVPLPALSRDEALGAAPLRNDDGFVVPQVLDGGDS